MRRTSPRRPAFAAHESVVALQECVPTNAHSSAGRPARRRNSCSHAFALASSSEHVDQPPPRLGAGPR
eukprot:4952991-Heterocapsa_arctica.AAC.1